MNSRDQPSAHLLLQTGVMRGRFAALLCVASLAGPAPAPADDFDEDEDEDEPPRYGVAIFESVIALGVQTAIYWGQANDRSVDLDLSWDWSSWRAKLTFDVVRFDS